MNSLSVATSIVELIIAACQVFNILKDFAESAKEALNSALTVCTEVTGISVYLNQLQGYVLEKQETSRSRRSLIMIEQVIVVLTDCVSIFFELKQTLEMLKTDQSMKVIDRLKWTMKEATIGRLLQRLQISKASLTLILTTLTW